MIVAQLQKLIRCKEFQRELIFLYRKTDCRSRKNGKLEMSVGTEREKDLFSVLIRNTSPSNVKWEDTKKSTSDGIIFGKPTSVKHTTTADISKIPIIKIGWTSNKSDAIKLMTKFYTHTWREHILIVKVATTSKKIQCIFIEAQTVDTLRQCYKVFDKRIFKQITDKNIRGVEFSEEFMRKLIDNAAFIETFDGDTKSPDTSDPIKERLDTLSQKFGIPRQHLPPKKRQYFFSNSSAFN